MLHVSHILNNLDFGETRKKTKTNFALMAKNGKNNFIRTIPVGPRWCAFQVVFWPLHPFAMKKVFFPDSIKGILNYNFMSNETFSYFNCPWGVKRGKTGIFAHQRGRTKMVQLETIKTPVKCPKILRSSRILVH